MKRFIVCVLLIIAFGTYNQLQAQFKNSDLAWGFAVGGADGSNSPGDQWVLQYRGFLQCEAFTPMLISQFGLGYTELKGDASTTSSVPAYTAETVIADIRLLFSPFSLSNLNPYIYAGFGISKELNVTGSDYLPMIPIGVGIQTVVSRGVLLSINGGYNLSLSDKLDNHARSNTYLNEYTNGKQDGFYGFTIGVAFTIGGGKDSQEEVKKKEIAEAEARRVKAEENAWHAKELADAESRRVQDSTNAATEAARVKEANAVETRNTRELTNAEARRIQDSTNAAAEAARVKEASVAEARHIQDSTNAAALRLAEQKNRDTLIVLLKGKTIVLDGVNFEFNKATLTKDSERMLWRAYNAMEANPNVRVVITGHTDNVGSQKSNQALSLKRAQAVKNWLVKKGITSNRMRTVGRGKNEPTSSNKTNEGRAENRCIEFYVQ
jgi:outer membrane protein OmpA-like peptidoglycan-associated protein